jgi:hypothetical protein
MQLPDPFRNRMVRENRPVRGTTAKLSAAAGLTCRLRSAQEIRIGIARYGHQIAVSCQ